MKRTMKKRNSPGNRLLQRLPDDLRRTLLREAEQVHLAPQQVIEKENEEIQYVYFPTTAEVSLRSVLEDGRDVETAIHGNQSMVGVGLCVGNGRALARGITQLGGMAWRVRAPIFRRAYDRYDALNSLVQRHLVAFVREISRISACNALHTVEQRYIRRLLTADDGVPEDVLKLTHGNFAQMLGVRRAGITIVATRLQNAGLIQYRRGEVTILNRPRLEAMVCSCYQAIKRDRQRMLSSQPNSLSHNGCTSSNEVGER
jgi:CRP-like cAMP-binding protein